MKTTEEPNELRNEPEAPNGKRAQPTGRKSMTTKCMPEVGLNP